QDVIACFFLEDRIPVEEQSSWQSIQTEINRTMRLLQTDVLFLQASRQMATRQQREQGCLQKIDKLIQFCHTLLDNDSNA
ncbi:MAG: heterocyst frequency control protein PatD, partial [Kamptonema sp. SIO4C4]|nr:heterocyst frequency control protein PatD [Kamptonema sp. SIO4C4]